MIRRPPRSTRTDTLFPYTTLFRSVLKRRVGQDHCGNWLLCARADRIRLKLQIRVLSSVEICGCIAPQPLALRFRSEEHTSELQSLMRISYAVFCLKKKKSLDTYHQRPPAY